MLTYTLRRILLMFPTLLGITALVFFVMAYSPGGIGGPLLDKFGNMQSEDARRIREYYDKRYGIHSPKIVQYARWLNLISPFGRKPNDDGSLSSHVGFKWPSFGDSLAQHRPVSSMIRESLPITLLLNLLSIPFIYGVGIMTGITVAKRPGSFYDRTTGILQLATWSVPVIWAAVMLVGLLANREYIKLFPVAGLHEADALGMRFFPARSAGAVWSRGYVLDAMWHLVLPLICLSYGGSAFLTKLTRGSLLENLHADYARTALAKGVAPHDVLYRHVFRNSLLSLITVLANVLPSLIGGSIVVETVFGIGGMGRLSYEAVMFRDREVTLAVTFIGGFIVLLSQILRDILYALADPRVSYE